MFQKKITTDFLDEVLQFQLQDVSTSVKTEEIQLNAKTRYTEAKLSLLESIPKVKT